MGVVYRATEIALARPVALKLIADDFAGDRKFRERFQRESMLAASIDHPNVIPIYEAGEVDGELYIAMRFVDGTDLLAAVLREGPLEPARAVRDRQPGRRRRSTPPTAAGSSTATSSPATCCSPARATEHAYLTDFGLVKTLTGEAPGMTTAGHFVGTLDYSSPEAIQGGDADARSDVYSLGCVLFYVLTRVSPFLRDSNVGTMFAHVNEPPPSLLEARPDLPPALGDVIERALAKDPDERQQTAGEFAREAQEALAAAPAARPAARAHAASRRARARSPTPGGPPQRARALGIILPAVLVLGLIAAALAALGVFKGDDPKQAGAPAGETATATATARRERHGHRDRDRRRDRRAQGRRLDRRRRGPRRHLGLRRRPGLGHRRQPRAPSSASTPRRTRRSASRSRSARRPTASPPPSRWRGSPPPATTGSAASRATRTRS